MVVSGEVTVMVVWHGSWDGDDDDCGFRQVWMRICRWCGISLCLPELSTGHFLQHLAISGWGEKRRKGWIIWVATVWCIWNCMNFKIFKGGTVNIPALVDHIQFKAWLWLKYKGKGFTFSFFRAVF